MKSNHISEQEQVVANGVLDHSKLSEPGPSCVDADIWQPLVSAFIDGELALEEAESVNAHLDECLFCQNALVEFATVESGLVESVILHGPSWLSPADDEGANRTDKISLAASSSDSQRGIASKVGQLHPVKPIKDIGLKSVRRSVGHRVLRWLPLAAAASVLGGLGFIAWNTPTPVTAEEFVSPVTEVELIHRQEERDQAMMVELLELELRALRREIAALEPAGHEQKQQISDTIEQLIKQVSHMRLSSNSFSTQEFENE